MMVGRRRAAVGLLLSALLLCAVLVLGGLLAPRAQVTDFARKNLAPCPQYPFGTDFMGRDMFARTLCGLSLSLRLGLLTATLSAALALMMGTAAAVLGRWADGAVCFVIDLLMGVPHILLLLLVSFACGKGVWGVMVAVTTTHWMSLARVLRGEVAQLRVSGYVQVARRLGVGPLAIARVHMLPHLLPQFLVGLILLFPHAILHEASITFLGFGLPPEQPAIGIILSEGMRHLVMGQWWLAVLPGALLVGTVLLFDAAGKSLSALTQPGSAHA